MGLVYIRQTPAIGPVGVGSSHTPPHSPCCLAVHVRAAHSPPQGASLKGAFGGDPPSPAPGSSAIHYSPGTSLGATAAWEIPGPGSLEPSLAGLQRDSGGPHWQTSLDLGLGAEQRQGILRPGSQQRGREGGGWTRQGRSPIAKSARSTARGAACPPAPGGGGWPMGSWEEPGSGAFPLHATQGCPRPRGASRQVAWRAPQHGTRLQHSSPVSSPHPTGLSSPLSQGRAPGGAVTSW